MKPVFSSLAYFDKVNSDCTFNVECTVTLPDVVNHEGEDVEIWAIFTSGTVSNKQDSKLKIPRSSYASPTLKLTATDLSAT